MTTPILNGLGVCAAAGKALSDVAPSTIAHRAKLHFIISISSHADRYGYCTFVRAVESIALENARQTYRIALWRSSQNVCDGQQSGCIEWAGCDGQNNLCGIPAPALFAQAAHRCCGTSAVL
jgi:hypothetical protein